MSDKCRYTLIGDYGCYPRVAYKSECGFDLVVLEGYDIGTSGERLNTLRMPVKTCARCGKEIDIVDPRIPLTLGPHDAIAYIRKRIGDGFAMEDFEAAQWLESRDAAQRQAGREEERAIVEELRHDDIAFIEERYAAVVEAARDVDAQFHAQEAADKMEGRPVPRYKAASIYLDIEKIRKALSDLDSHKEATK